ncbi:retrotransposon protein, putative, ty1-copia subclass [Tanacetum coccineum]
MRSNKLYKFCDGTLSSVQKVLHDIASSLEMDYLPKRRWSKLEKKRSRIMIKAIDQQLFERRLMRNLEKFPISPASAGDSAANVLAEWNAVCDAYNEVACFMLGSMTLELHRQFETYSPYEILQELKSMFEKQAGVEQLDLIQTFHACKQEEGKPVGPYVIKMKNYVLLWLCLFKHKHEVESQLGKTLKALRLDRGDEYISQEFKDYLKACGIVQQLTPPYTPQHNESAIRILNMVSTNKVDKTSYELWYGKILNLSYLKDTQRKRWVTISTFHLKKKIVIARYAEFLDKNLISQEVSGRAVELEEIQDENTSPSEITRKIPMEVEEVEEHSLRGLNEPANYKSAMLDLESDKWLDAMNAEMQSMKDNQTDMDGIVHTYKAYLVVKGYTQTYPVDYEETFSPVADIRAIRILIDIEAFYDYEIWKMDVKIAFLNGYLDEDIYMVMDNSKRGYIPMQERLDLNKTQGASTPREVKRMQIVPYASVIGYDYMKKIVLRRADLKEYTIAERDFKYLYPSDFKDLYLLNLQGHLNHLPPDDKKILTTAVNLWTGNLVIRQRVEDFQLGIESYQT